MQTAISTIAGPREVARERIFCAEHRLTVALNTSLDYLTGLTDIEFDSNILNRISEIVSLLNEDRNHVFKIVDALIRDAKAKK